MGNETYDLIIIGAGPGGYVAAIRAAQLGLKTAIVEKSHLGGVCLNWGCIPTKALLRSAEVYRHLQHAENFGLGAKEVSHDTAAIVHRSREISAQLAGGVGFLLRKNKVDVIWGAATITAPGQVTVSAAENPPKGSTGAGTYRARHIIVATGARPRPLPSNDPDFKLSWSYREAMVPEQTPKSLLVVGSGAIGMEFASFYRTLGTEVTVLELLPQILPVEDEEISSFARKQFERQGIRILTEVKLRELEQSKSGLVASVEMKDSSRVQMTAERVIAAIGVIANTEGLGLESLGVKIEKGVLVTDGLGRTNIEGIYAIGDVAGAPMLAHKAEHEGIICVEAIAGGKPEPLDKARIPGCTYCHPQIASVGLTEKAARAAGHDVRVGRFPFIGNGKAIALGEPDGLMKTVFDSETGQLLGAHLAGAEVTELIHGFVLAMNLETTEKELMHTVFPHPPLSETMHEGVLAAYGRAIHI